MRWIFGAPLVAWCIGLVASPALAEPVDFVRDVRPILEKHCYGCHGESKQKSGLRLDVKAKTFQGGELFGTSLIPGKAQESPLIQVVADKDSDLRMPPEGPPLEAAQIEVLVRWVNEGAAWPDGVDRVTLTDPREHWSFQPVAHPEPPPVQNRSWPRDDIDRFILHRLEQEQLFPAPEADRATWLRRVSFDLVGLPPTPEQVAAFQNDSSHEAYERVVNELLDSPRYGERWAQHWLDVVRYADTHGFEVNTERPHAWPYRDYVIRSFNQDTPYDRFVREQIAGDTLGADAATGFLITASVLLPGQIGADEPSKRLARQDALDEIVVNIGQTFLGLSIGCARCHEHKFDPISQRDYYSMQAFIAGVEYADREVHTPEADASRERETASKKRLAEIDNRLARLVPPARPIAALKVTNAKENVETFGAVEARVVRFTIHDANRHPSLGLIEPCLDEFQIWTDEPEPRNVALASLGTKVTASGSRESAVHQLSRIHDGIFGNSSSWMSDTAGRGWVQFELAAPARIARVVWSRDRDGQFTDRLATAYTLEAGLSADSLQSLVHSTPRPSVNARQNIDRFAKPVTARRIRFTIRETNSLEPCLDELEVFDLDGANIASASSGANVSSSGDTVSPDRHELRFINDGQYGNSRSWMSNMTGQGWVVIEFDRERTIDRVVWGRDREGKYADRLATSYLIEVSGPQEEWTTIADSSDRLPPAPNEPPATFSLAGLSAADANEANRLLQDRQSLEGAIQAGAQERLAFAGTFREPDQIRLLTRGDPEQPKDPVVPAVLTILGGKRLPGDAPEQQRRRELADWIASPENPLTARVMINRIWQGHFGTGLVETASDFGRGGLKPSHPELLDWLASEFIRSGWSVKQMHKRIVLSATYRQSSRFDPVAADKDADARWLWRFPPRRLEAEIIRDSMLSISGELNVKMFGSGFDLFDKRGGLSGFTPIESHSRDGLRRMVYAHKVRREREAVFGAFDCPDGGQSMARRRESTTPIQALNLLNSRFTLERSAAFAARVQREAGDDLRRQIDRAYWLALSRGAEEDETRLAEPVVREHGLAVLCRALYNSNEALFVP